MGVEKEVLRAGTGFGKNGNLSEKFWSTKDSGQKPFSFKIGLGNVIKGWDEGVLGMQLGEVARLRVICKPFGLILFPHLQIQMSYILLCRSKLKRLSIVTTDFLRSRFKN